MSSSKTAKAKQETVGQEKREECLDLVRTLIGKKRVEISKRSPAQPEAQKSIITARSETIGEYANSGGLDTK